MTERELICSFCGKDGEDVDVLLAGPIGFICDECVDLCNVIIAEWRADQERGEMRPYADFREEILERLESGS